MVTKPGYRLPVLAQTRQSMMAAKSDQANSTIMAVNYSFTEQSVGLLVKTKKDYVTEHYYRARGVMNLTRFFGATENHLKAAIKTIVSMGNSENGETFSIVALPYFCAVQIMIQTTFVVPPPRTGQSQLQNKR